MIHWPEGVSGGHYHQYNKRCNIHHTMAPFTFVQCDLLNGHEGDCLVSWKDKKWKVSSRGIYNGHKPEEARKMTLIEAMEQATDGQIVQRKYDVAGIGQFTMGGTIEITQYGKFLKPGYWGTSLKINLEALKAENWEVVV